jgi:putative membrane protein
MKPPYHTAEQLPEALLSRQVSGRAGAKRPTRCSPFRFREKNRDAGTVGSQPSQTTKWHRRTYGAFAQSKRGKRESPHSAGDVAPQISMSIGLLLSVVYKLVGILLLMIGYKMFEWITPFSVNDALSKDQNRAVGIVVGAIFIGIAIIVAAALG